MAEENFEYNGLKVSSFYVEVSTSESIPPEARDNRNIIPLGDYKFLISKQAMKCKGLDTDVNKEVLEVNCQKFIRSLTHEAREARDKN